MKNLETTLALLTLWSFVSCSDPVEHDTNEAASAIAVEGHPVVVQLNRIFMPKVDHFTSFGE